MTRSRRSRPSDAEGDEASPALRRRRRDGRLNIQLPTRCLVIEMKPGAARRWFPGIARRIASTITATLPGWRRPRYLREPLIALQADAVRRGRRLDFPDQQGRYTARPPTAARATRSSSLRCRSRPLASEAGGARRRERRAPVEATGIDCCSSIASPMLAWVYLECRAEGGGRRARAPGVALVSAPGLLPGVEGARGVSHLHRRS